MRTIFTDAKELRAALKAPGAQVFCVTKDHSRFQISQAQKKQGRIQVQLHPSDEWVWTSDILTIYREV